MRSQSKKTTLDTDGLYQGLGWFINSEDILEDILLKILFEKSNLLKHIFNKLFVINRLCSLILKSLKIRKYNCLHICLSRTIKCFKITFLAI